MCGRYVCGADSRQLAQEFDAEDAVGAAQLGPDYNVAPTKTVPIVRYSRRVDPARRVVTPARWGLVPPWSKDPAQGSRMFNARAESLTDKAAYRGPFRRHRCLVPVNGWYEWSLAGGRATRRQPYYVSRRDGALIAFAGLWEVWGRGDNRLITVTIVTTAAVGSLAEIHLRMPLMLAHDDWASWLGDPVSAGQEPTPAQLAAAHHLLDAPKDALVTELELRPVGRAVGNADNNGAQLTERVEPEAETLTLW